MNKVNLRMVRQLRASKGRMFAITMIVAAGVAIYAGLFNSMHAVIRTRDVLAERNALADYQVHFWAINRDELPDLSAVKGVTHVEPRLVLNGTIELPNNPNPIQSRMYFLPLAGQGKLNRIELAEGRYFQGEADLDSVIIDKALATYHGYKVGDDISLTVGQARYTRKIIGISLTPEHLVATANPEFLIPQKGSLGVLYMPKEKQDDLLGADLITNVSLQLDKSVDVDAFEEVLKPLFSSIEVDRYETRADNYAYAFLKKDIDSISLFIPSLVGVFVAICGFVAFAVFGQIIRSQRQEIGTMMALGITRARIVRSYLMSGLLVGVMAGFVGLLMSLGVTAAFNMDYQKGMGLSIILPYHDTDIMIRGFILAVVAALVSVALPTLMVMRLQPIEAVRVQTGSAGPQRPGALVRLFGRSGITRFSIRNITRDKRRFALTVLSIAGSIAVGLAYRTSSVSVDHTFEDYFLTDHWDVIVEYVEPQVALTAEGRISDLPDVELIEEYAKGNVKITGGTASKVVQAFGLDYPSKLKEHEVEQGSALSGARGELFMNKRIADQLGVKVGDTVNVRGVEDALPMKVVGMTAFSPEQVYVTKADAQFLLKQENKVAGALVRSLPGKDTAVADAARDRKIVSNVYLKTNIVRALKTHAKELLVIISIAIALAMMVACLVITSTILINMLEREPDYAMVRVLGYPHQKIQLGVMMEIFATGGLGLILSVPLSFVISSYLNAQVGKAFFNIKTVQDPVSIAIVLSLTLAFLVVAARPGIKRIQTMHLAETVRRKSMG